MNKVFSAFLLVFALILSYMYGADTRVSLPHADDGLFLVTKVVDGDTIKIENDEVKETVRLIGIDTPETVHPQKAVECFGHEASNRVKELIEGEVVQLEFDESQSSRDRYGRLLAYVFSSGGRNINKMLIEDGFAYEYTHSDPYKYQAEFKNAQRVAQQHGYGLWNERTCNGQLEK